MPMQDNQQHIGYVNTITFEEATESGIKAQFPNTSFPKTFVPPEGFDYLYAAQQPLFNEATQKVVKDTPIKINNKWHLAWKIVELTEEEKQITDTQKEAKVRDIRNKLLADSDWTQVADAPVDKAAWAVYRQTLRDITAQAGFPWDITWPTEP